MKIQRALFAVFMLVAMAAPAMAHPHANVPHSHGLGSGFSHPWLGLDHLLAMVAVGLLGARIGGRACWLIPASFLGCLAVGGTLGITGVSLQWVEVAIALSVVLLGAALAAGKQYSVLGAALAVAVMGLFHGHAHGTEIPSMATPAVYAAGFMLATALLHGLGIMTGKWLMQSESRAMVLRWSGAAISATGALLLLGTL